MSKIYFLKFPLEPSLGGAEFHTLKLAQDFQKQGHQVKLITSDRRLFRLFEKNRLPRKRIFTGFEPTSRWALLLWPITYLIALARFKNLLMEIPPGNILLMQSMIEKLILTPLALILSHRGRGNFRMIWLEHKIPGRWLAANPLKFRYLSLARKVKIMTVSNFAKQEFVKLGVPEKNIRVVYPTPTSFSPIRLRRTGEKREGAFAIGILSRLDPEKGVLDFIKIIIPELKDRPDWRVLIAGEGLEQKNLESMIDNHNLNTQIKLLGFVNNLDGFFDQISVLVYPTKVPEAFGISVLEAAARGTPAIASNLGALPEIIDHGKSGFLVDQSLPDPWMKYLNLLTDSEFSRTVSRAAITRAQTFFKTDKRSVSPVLSPEVN